MNKRRWLKDGFVGILAALGALTVCLVFLLQNIAGAIVLLPLILTGTTHFIFPCGRTCGYGDVLLYVGPFIPVVMWLGFYFVLGVVVGWIYRKIKNRKKLAA